MSRIDELVEQQEKEGKRKSQADVLIGLASEAVLFMRRHPIAMPLPM
jgi:hypothetical protein